MHAVDKCAIRYQNAFVGVRGSRNVAPANFSYQTRDTDDPRNLLIVSTPMGLYFHVDGVGEKRLMPYDISGETLTNKWIKVEESAFAVGHGPSGGEAVSEEMAELGVRGSGRRGNRMLIVSVPLQQKTVEDDMECNDDACVYRSLSSLPVGRARAARISVGDVHSQEDVHHLDLEMDPSEAVVVTQIDWNVLTLPPDAPTVQVGDDAVAFAIRDMNRQYDLCDAQCKLSELPAMLHKMTPAHHKRIRAKMGPFEPRSNALAAFI
jgi:hypothetical protein